MTAGQDVKRGMYSRFFARCYDRFQSDYEAWMSERKRKLFDGIAGTVVEIGPGTGVNFKYLPSDVQWIGVEPNPYMHRALRERAGEAGIEPELRGTRNGILDIPSAIADVVIATIALCSVPDLARSLSEVRRVLRPRGRFLFIEHVAARQRTTLRVAQHVMKPLWYLFGDGCRINRDTGTAIARAGFASVEFDEFRVPRAVVPRLVSPHIAGLAVR